MSIQVHIRTNQHPFSFLFKNCGLLALSSDFAFTINQTLNSGVFQHQTGMFPHQVMVFFHLKWWYVPTSKWYVLTSNSGNFPP